MIKMLLHPEMKTILKTKIFVPLMSINGICSSLPNSIDIIRHCFHCLET